MVGMDQKRDLVPSRAVLRELAPGKDPIALLLSTLLARLGRLYDAALHQLTRPHGVTPSEVAVLMTLWWFGPPHQSSPSELRSSLVQTSGGLTATLRRLEGAQLVDRVPNPSDGRGLFVRLTPHGLRVAREVLEDLDAYWEPIIARTDRPAELLASVRRLLDVLERREGLRPTRDR
jgi:DNA-binding MarR family transcriptional regulator